MAGSGRGGANAPPMTNSDELWNALHEQAKWNIEVQQLLLSSGCVLAAHDEVWCRVTMTLSPAERENDGCIVSMRIQENTHATRG